MMSILAAHLKTPLGVTFSRCTWYSRIETGRLPFIECVKHVLKCAYVFSVRNDNCVKFPSWAYHVVLKPNVQ